MDYNNVADDQVQSKYMNFFKSLARCNLDAIFFEGQIGMDVTGHLAGTVSPFC